MNKEDYKLPVSDIFYEAIFLPRKHFINLMRFGMPLFLVSLLSVIYFRSYSESDIPVIGMIVFTLLYLLTIVMAIIGCHRTFLLQPEEVIDTKSFRWTGRELRYAGWWFLIGLVVSVISIPFGLLLVQGLNVFENITENKTTIFLITSVLNIPLMYLISRWSLILPATAVDIKNKTLSWAWELSYGNGWRLTLLIGFIPFLTSLVFEFLPVGNSIFYFTLLTISWIMISVIEIGLLSLSYSYLSKSSSDAIS
jgi:hypothetical protein